MSRSSPVAKNPPDYSPTTFALAFGQKSPLFTIDFHLRRWLDGKPTSFEHDPYEFLNELFANAPALLTRFYLTLTHQLVESI
ncbi:hypothetical protein FRC12_009515, partial [Ceratobasidium sp. 428]